MSHNNFIRMAHINYFIIKTGNISHFRDSSCIPLSFLLSLSTFVASFAERFDIIIEFSEVENASFWHFIVSSFRLCDKA